MKRPLLTAALITKNEELFLGDCLQSLKGVVDEIVVVDTGSTDRSMEIAAGYGAQVSQFPWIGDFSAARNRALDLSNGEWILYIDADERVRRESVAHLRTELSAPSFAGYRVLLHSLKGHTPFWCLRLFRNDASLRFTGVIHESTWPALNRFCARSGMHVGNSRMNIDHEGYEANQEAKHNRNLPLLLKGLEQDPERIYSWCHLADIYMDIGQRDLGEAAWRSALTIIRKRGRRTPEDILPYLGLIELGIQAGRDESALFSEATTLFPVSVQLEWLRGRILMKGGDFAEAIEAFQRLVERGRTGNIDHEAAYDLRLFGAFAYDAIATCLLRLGRYHESRFYFELAAMDQPERLEYRVKQALCSHLESSFSSKSNNFTDQISHPQ